MSDTVVRVDLAGLLTEAHRILDVLQAADLTPCTDEEVLAALRATERLRRRLEPVDHVQILEVERRGLAAASGARTVARLLGHVLDLDVTEARARHNAAEAAGARRSLLGEPLEPAYPVVAAAQADGLLSARQARVITHCVEKLPDAVKHEGPGVEARLVGFARDLHLTPQELAKAAQREVDWLDPDGKHHDVEYRRRARTVGLHVRPDGSCSGSFEGTAELGEFLQVVFDALAAPKPEANGTKDTRTAGQRRHDALIDAVKAGISAGTLGSTGGVLATVVLTMTTDAYATRTGFARTGHGAQVPAREALSWAGGDHRLMITAFNSLKAIIAYAATHTAVPYASLDGWGAAQGPSLTARSSAPSVQAQPPHHRMADQQTNLRRRRHPALRLPPPRIREIGLVRPHGRRPTRLDPTPLDRPHPNPHPHLSAATQRPPRGHAHDRTQPPDHERVQNCPTP